MHNAVLISPLLFVFIANDIFFSSGILFEDIVFIKLNLNCSPSLHLTFWICPPLIVYVLRFANFSKYIVFLFKIKYFGFSIIIISLLVFKDSLSNSHLILLLSLINEHFALNTSGVSSDIINDKSNPSVSFNIIDFSLFCKTKTNLLFSLYFSANCPAKTVTVCLLLNPSKIIFCNESSTTILLSTSSPIYKS